MSHPLSLLSLKITAHTPLSLGDQSKMGNFEETVDYIPGAMLRGAAAARTLAQCTQPAYLKDHSRCPDRDTCPFWQLFGADEIAFGNAYAGPGGPVYPYPLTARSCKYHLAYPDPDDPSREAHGVFDVLVERFLYELLSDTKFPARELLLPPAWQGRLPRLAAPYRETCRKCPADAKPQPGYYSQGPTPIPARKPFISRAAHVGINRARFVAEEGLLFTQESLDTRDTGAFFFSQVCAADVQIEMLTQALQEGEHFIGRGRSRGLGRVEIGVNPPFESAPLAKRQQSFQERILAEWSRLRRVDKDLPERLPGRFISLTLVSPLILAGPAGPHLAPAPEEAGLPGAHLLRAWTRPVVTGGWDVAAGLPRRTRLAAAAGSVYLYYLPAQNLDLSALARLEVEGLGEERSRGFGQVHICAPFHAMQS